AARELRLTCMANLLATTEERVYFKDLESRFLFVSAGWIAAYAPGRSPAELTGKTDFDVFSYQHAADAFADEQEIIQTGKPIAGQVERETYTGRPDAWVSTTKMPLLAKPARSSAPSGSPVMSRPRARGARGGHDRRGGRRGRAHGRRHRHGHPRRRPGADLRALLPDGRRHPADHPRDRPGSGRRHGHRGRAQRRHHRGEHRRPGKHVHGPPAAPHAAHSADRSRWSGGRPGAVTGWLSLPGQSCGASPPAIWPGSFAGRRRLIAGMTEVSSALAASAAWRLACCSSALTAAA